MVSGNISGICRVAVILQPRGLRAALDGLDHESSESLAAFQTTSSHLRAALQGEYFAVQ